MLVVARVKEVEKPNKNWISSSVERVKFHCLPHYIGPWQYIKQLKRLKKGVKSAISLCDCALLRVPGAIGTLTWKHIKNTGKIYGLEVCGDPWESLASGSVKSIVRPIVRVIGTFNLKRQCQLATATAYVTNHTLQRRYPPRSELNRANITSDIRTQSSFTTNYSSVEISSNGFSVLPREFNNLSFRILNVGSMETLYKAQDVQIKAIKVCRDRGYDIRLDFVGDGRCRSEFEKLTLDLDIQMHIGFLGMLPGQDKVFEELDKSDLFILPSLVEGLPRALIEAMTRRLPCIATNVGGISELLSLEDLVLPNDYISLADKIVEVITNKERMKQMSERNYSKAQEFRSDVLRKRRIDFYTFIKNKAEVHL